MNILTNISDLVHVRSGTHRLANPHGEVVVIQRSNFSAPTEMQVFAGDRRVVSWLGLKRSRLQRGDLLLVARGEDNETFLFPGYDAPAIASSNFIVLRPFSDRAIPAYLLWYLNTSHCQRQLRAVARGSRIQTLSKKAVSHITVPLPDSRTQKRIAELAQLHRREQQLNSELHVLRDQLLETQLLITAQNLSA